MTTADALTSAASTLAELAPVLRVASTLDPGSLARLKFVSTGTDRPPTASVLVRLPFGVLAARTITITGNESAADEADFDLTVSARELLAWLDGDSSQAPGERNAMWRTGLPPPSGWRRIDTVPDTAVRDLVRAGALAVQEALARDAAIGARPHAAADAVLDTVVLTVTDADLSATVTLRMLSALTRLRFLPPGSHIAIDTAGRWTRVAAEYGSVYVERPGSGLNVL